MGYRVYNGVKVVFEKNTVVGTDVVTDYVTSSKT